MEYKLYNYTKDVGPEKFEEAPFGIDYNILGLHKKRTFNKGELILVEYYGDYDLQTKEYSDLVLKEERTYHRDADLLAYQRDMKVTWYLIDDSVGDCKETKKFYAPDESIREGIKRRDNIISNVKLSIFFLLGKTDAYDLLNSIFNNLGLYKDGFRQPLLDELSTINKTYLDSNMVSEGVTARMYLINELTL